MRRVGGTIEISRSQGEGREERFRKERRSCRVHIEIMDERLEWLEWLKESRKGESVGRLLRLSSILFQTLDWTEIGFPCKRRIELPCAGTT